MNPEILFEERGVNFSKISLPCLTLLIDSCLVINVIHSLSLQAAVQLVHVVAMQHCAEESCGQPAVLHVSHPP